MKKLWFLSFALTLLIMTGCAMNEFDGATENALDAGNGEISFSMGTPNTTRASVGGADAAQKLGNKFIVLGWNTKEGNTFDVYPFYSINWEGNAGSSKSNVKGWEYVGYMSEPIYDEPVEQSIKYWDYKASQYDFVAWSVQGTGAFLQDVQRNYSETGYKTTALSFQVSDANAAANVYIADQETRQHEVSGGVHPDFGGDVTLTFRNLAAKVRIGIYETVPGYSIKNVEFYTDASKNADATKSSNATLFVTDGHTPAYKLPTSGDILVKYIDSGVNENDAVAVTSASETATSMAFGTFTPSAAPEYKEAANGYLGRTSKEATLSQGSANGWTYVFPNDTTELNLKVNYTLVPRDGARDTITVTGATAVVPASFGIWKANFAYTYLFKISDNTSGTTGDDDDPDDPKGLYPITFDACVEEMDEGNTQETVTTVANPSFTTYQNGSMVTANDEYQASATKNIWVSLDTVNGKGNGCIDLTSSNTKLYTAINLDNSTISEENVANYMNNGIVLTDVSALLSFAKTIPAAETTDNIAISFNNTLAYFAPQADKIYVVEYTNAESKKFYKVIKVENVSSATASYTLKAYKEENCINKLDSISEGGVFYVAATESVTIGNASKNCAIIGAVPAFEASDFKIEVTSNDSVYKFTSIPGKTGTNLPVKLNNTTINVEVLNYEIVLTGGIDNYAAGSVTDSAICVTLGNSHADTVSVSSITSDNAKVTTEAAAAGSRMFKLKVADGATGTCTLTYSNNGMVVAEKTINILTYQFSADKKALNVGGVAEDSILTLTLKLGSNVGKYKVTNADQSVAALYHKDSTFVDAHKTDSTNASGLVTLKGISQGTAKVTAPGASIEIPVYNFAVAFYTESACSTLAPATLVAGTTYYVKFTDNGTAQNAAVKASAGSLVKAANTGVYKWTAPAASSGDATIKYTYKNIEFTLFQQSF